MNILIISVITPFPIDTGGNAGTFKLIEHTRQDHDVTFISLPSSKSKLEGLKKAWPNVNIQTRRKVKKQSSLKDTVKKGVKDLLKKNKSYDPTSKLLLYKTNLVDGFYEDFVEDVIQLTTANKYDLIQVEYIELAPIVYFLPKNIPSVFIHHELRFRRMEYEYGLMDHKTQNDFWKIQTTKELEIGLMNRYNKVLTVSEDDKNYLIEAGVVASKVKYSPSPVELAERDTNKDFIFNNTIVYLGPEAHYPNEDGIRWFLNNCWPAITKEFPQLRFQIVGKWSEETKASMPTTANVEFLGFVEDLGEVFEGAALIVPLRIGGGMRMKILEAISWNTPILTTSIGAEGLPMQHESNCFITDHTSEFITAIGTLKENNSVAKSMIVKAKEILGSTFSIKHCGKTREEAYKELTAI